MEKSIGILGGMGPLATADLLRKIVLLTKAEKDGDHVRVFIDDNPRIPDRTAAILAGGENPLPQMTDSLEKLEKCGASCIIMPCNTAHYFLPELQKRTKTPFISMLEATAKACAARYPGKTAAVLATRGTLATGLYEEALAAEHVPHLIPDESEKDALMHLIYDVVKAAHAGAGALGGASARPSRKGRGLFHPRLHGAAHRGTGASAGRAVHRSDGGACTRSHPFLRIRDDGVN